MAVMCTDGLSLSFVLLVSSKQIQYVVCFTRQRRRELTLLQPEHANDLLREVMDEQGWNTIQRKCGTLARVFGLIRRCELDERKGRVVVQLLDASGTHA